MYMGTWGLVAQRANHQDSPELLYGCCSCGGSWKLVPVSDGTLEEGVSVYFAVSALLVQFLLASCPTVIVPEV